MNGVRGSQLKFNSHLIFSYYMLTNVTILTGGWTNDILNKNISRFLAAVV